jgi:peptidoglycan/xylan/chitin deacetylase (PgdA/CDA1 family)
MSRVPASKSHSPFALILATIFASFGLGLFLPGLDTIANSSLDGPTSNRMIQSTPNMPLKKPIVLRIPILLYHYVENIENPKKDRKRVLMNVPPAVFGEQLKTLADAGAHFITVSEIGNALDHQTPLPVKPVALTFDDGYRDFYTDVFPLLKKYRAKATAYLIPGFFGQPNYLTTSQIQEILNSGLVEIAAHTLHHPPLRGMVAEKATEEILGSKQFLEKQFGVSVLAFAYPFGSYDNSALKIVRDAGFTTAVSTLEGVKASLSNRFLLRRLRPEDRIGKQLLEFLESDFSSATRKKSATPPPSNPNQALSKTDDK